MPFRSEPVLTERQKRILEAVVNTHIRTAQPVGSKTIVSEYRLTISSATVRLEFAALGQLGLIFQPHTSAGRVPSDMGYRVFVDEVLTVRPLPLHRLRLWEQRLAQRYGEVRDVLKAACQWLSRFTDYASWTILPRREMEGVRGVHFSVLPDRRVVVMLLGHRLIHKAFILPEAFDLARWQWAANWLSARLYGVAFPHLLRMTWEQLATPETAHDPLLPVAFDLVKRLAEEAWQSEFHLEGLSKVLNEPEFQNMERTQRLIAFWEAPHKLAALCEASMDRAEPPIPKAWVRIGTEIPLAELQDCSLVAAPYFFGELPLGMIGVLGPKRMRYAETIPAVESFARLLSHALTAMLI